MGALILYLVNSEWSVDAVFCLLPNMLDFSKWMLTSQCFQHTFHCMSCRNQAFWCVAVYTFIEGFHVPHR